MDGEFRLDKPASAQEPRSREIKITRNHWHQTQIIWFAIFEPWLSIRHAPEEDPRFHLLVRYSKCCVRLGSVTLFQQLRSDLEIHLFLVHWSTLGINVLLVAARFEMGEEPLVWTRQLPALLFNSYLFILIRDRYVLETQRRKGSRYQRY